MSGWLFFAVFFAVWLSLGWLGARLQLIAWHNLFGKYEGALGMAGFFMALGPIGLLVGLILWADSLPGTRQARFWGLR